MSLLKLEMKVRKGTPKGSLTNVRFSSLESGKFYVLRIWAEKRFVHKAVEFVGFGQSLDELTDERPLWNKTNGGFYFFKWLNDDGFEEIVPAFGAVDSFYISTGIIYPNTNIRDIERVTVQRFKN